LVLDQCLWFLDQPATKQSAAALAFLQPVLLYLFCDPNYHGHFAAMRGALLDRLLELCGEECCNSSSNSSCNSSGSSYLACLARLMSWLPLDNRVSLAEVSQYMVKFFTFLLGMGTAQADSHLR
jgi:hypothetical protein